jgi:hypothetical protein
MQTDRRQPPLRQAAARPITRAPSPPAAPAPTALRTHLDLVVVGENGNLIASDNEYAKHAEVDVRPRWTGEFGIYIKMTRGTADGAHFSLMIAYD